MSIAGWRRSGALAVLVAAASLSPVRADEEQARVETTVLVRINQADHEGVDGSSLRVAPRSAHVAWRADGEAGTYWTVDGKKGTPYPRVEPLVFSDDGASHAYLAFDESNNKRFLVLDGRERDLTAWAPDDASLRLLPGARAVFVGRDVAAPAQSVAVWIDGAVDPAFPAIQRGTLSFSADGRRRAYVVQSTDGDVVVVDGRPGKSHAKGTLGPPRWSADGTRHAYEVKAPPARVVVDGVEGPVFHRVMSLTFAPRGARYFHVAVRGGKPVVVVDGKEEPELVDVMAPGPVWSADGAHLGYVAVKVADKKAVRRAVIDGVDGPVFTRIGAESLLFSPAGKRHAYWAGNGPKPFYVVDGVAQKEADLVGKHAAFSPDSKRFAYSVQRSGKWFVVIDGVEGPPTDGLGAGFPVFTSDSAHVVYEAAVGEAWHVFVDGKPGPAYVGFEAGTLALGVGTSSVAVVAHRGDASRIVVDGVESTEEFRALIPGSTLVADGPRSFRAWVARGDELLHLRATLIPGAAPR